MKQQRYRYTVSLSGGLTVNLDRLPTSTNKVGGFGNYLIKKKKPFNGFLQNWAICFH